MTGIPASKHQSPYVPWQGFHSAEYETFRKFLKLIAICTTMADGEFRESMENYGYVREKLEKSQRKLAPRLSGASIRHSFT